MDKPFKEIMHMRLTLDQVPPALVKYWRAMSHSFRETPVDLLYMEHLRQPNNNHYG